MIRLLKKCISEQSPLRLLYHKIFGILAAFRYAFPAKHMKVIGVTGTDGKTTTTYLTTQLLHKLGKRVGMASTVAFQIGDYFEQNKTHKTTLGRFGLQKLLYRMKQEGVTHAILEVSSHALAQSRVWGIPFATGVFTNLAREHLDYHGTMEEYFQAKAKLFHILSKNKDTKRTIIVNGNDSYALHLLSFPAEEKIIVCTKPPLPEVREKSTQCLLISNIESSTLGQTCDLTINDTLQLQIQTLLLGDFNMENICFALSVAYSEGYSFEESSALIPELLSVPGRMEVIPLKKGRVVIDYAVTPQALEKCYQTLRTSTSGKLIAILGACGDRDQGKRAQMGMIATQFCDHVIFTDEEPYSEDPKQILAMLTREVKESGRGNYEIIEERREGIIRALSLLDEGDTCILTGMGDQTSRIVGDKKIFWSDREVVQEEAGKLGKR